jgi:hypothetical protein
VATIPATAEYCGKRSTASTTQPIFPRDFNITFESQIIAMKFSTLSTLIPLISGALALPVAEGLLTPPAQPFAYSLH